MLRKDQFIVLIQREKYFTLKMMINGKKKTKKTKK